MAKRKLQRFAEVSTFPNVLQPRITFPLSEHPLKGKWNSDFFKNTHPLVLELGCGKGEYSVNLARKYPLRNFIGVDIKGNRIWRGSKTALEENIRHVAFLRSPIEYISCFFGPSEVSEIWITFPDPQPQKSRAKKRLTSPQFLDRYRKILAPGSVLHLKTDSRPLYEYTLGVLGEQNDFQITEHTHDVYRIARYEEATSIQTFYEQMFLAEGLPICYLRFVYNG